MFTIKSADIEDLKSITNIYNEAILNTNATFDTEPKTEEEQINWLNSHSKKYPVIVGILDKKIIGWASLSKWSDRCAYADTAEIFCICERIFSRIRLWERIIECCNSERG